MITLDDDDKKIAYGPWERKPVEKSYADLVQAQLDAGEAVLKMQQAQIRLLTDELLYLRGYVAAMKGEA